MEVDQRWVIELAADRQKYICQSQSINLFYPADVSKKTLHDHHMMAWQRGMKTLYYVRSKAMKRAENVSTETVRQVIFADDGCLSCEG